MGPCRRSACRHRGAECINAFSSAWKAAAATPRPAGAAEYDRTQTAPGRLRRLRSSAGGGVRRNLRKKGGRILADGRAYAKSRAEGILTTSKLKCTRCLFGHGRSRRSLGTFAARRAFTSNRGQISVILYDLPCAYDATGWPTRAYCSLTPHARLPPPRLFRRGKCRLTALNRRISARSAYI